MTEIKKINILSEELGEAPKKRIITTKDKWLLLSELNYKEQLNNILELSKDIENMTTICKTIIQQLKVKISGYRNQDVKKKILNDEKLIDLKEVINLLCKSKLECHYCNKNVLVIYDNVRDMSQWTLDRINNDIGHNTDNVLISCLGCNLQRKRTCHDKYLFTKQLNIVKKDSC